MPDLSAAISAAVRAVRGESDLDALMPALADVGLARVIALAPEAHSLVRAVAALCGRLPGLLDPPTRADPALHGDLARLIGTPAGWSALRSWAEVALAGWGHAHMETLIAAVPANMVDASVAAALIGPGDEAAVLLHTASDAAFAIRRWGRSNPAAPTAWTEAMSPAERDRLITALLRDGSHVASCLPWLPPDAVRTADASVSVGDALDAFAAASPTARTLHADRIRQLVADARPERLAELTRLACVMQTDEVWTRVQMLIRESPDDAWRVVVAAPWDDLADGVRAAILDLADESDVCAAVAAARGRRDAATAAITEETAAAFFAALAPAVWDALDPATQQRWGQALAIRNAPLAVRSLGLRPEVLAQARIADDLVRAAQRHARDERTRRWALLPVALRRLPPAAAHALVAAMPTLPPDPGAFFIIAGGGGDPDVCAPARAALRSPADLALAVTLQRGACGHDRALPACAAIHDALHGRTWDDLAPIMPLLDADARAALMPDANALVARLAHPDRQDALRRALARLANLAPAVAVPVRVALKRWMPWNTPKIAAAVATALHAHGDVFLALTDALADDDRRVALLPLPKNAALAGALRAMAHDAPPSARRLAHAIQDHDRSATLQALLHAPPHPAAAVWQALDDSVREAIGAVVSAEASDADPLAVHDPIAALALAALQSERDDLRDAGRTALTARSARIRAIWEQLPPKVRQTLGEMPAFADLPIVHARPVIRRGRRVSRLS